MAILKKIRNILSLDIKTIILFSEAFVYLGWARILTFQPFAKVAPRLGVQMQETPSYQNQADTAVLNDVARAVKIMSNHTFWECKCLVKAIAGLKILERRRIESTLYLGIARDEGGELIAHAWLRSGSFYITGFESMNSFTIVGKFAKKIRCK